MSNSPTTLSGLAVPNYEYHSVAGQTAAALQAIKPLTLLDFIDSRVREIDAERNRLSMLREQLTSAGLSVSVDDIRRVLG